MFKTIKWKITTLFVLFILATELIVGVSGIIAAISHSHNRFRQDMTNVFDAGLRNELNSLANVGNISIQKTDENGAIVWEEIKSYESIRDTLNCYLSALSISSSRFYAVLDGGTGSVLCTSSNAGEITTTPTIMEAIHGNTSMEVGLMSPYLDFALPVKSDNEVTYIIYIKDLCEAQRAIAENMFFILIIVMLLSIVLSVISGNLFASSVTGPIKELTINAKKLADGDLGALTEASGNDELSLLINSLLHLAHSRKEINEKAIGEQIKVETILQNMTDGILAFNLKGRLIHFNPEAQRLLKRNYLDDVQFDRFFREIQADITLGDLVYMKPDGSIERDIQLDKNFLHLEFATFNADNDGGIIVIIHDITRQEQLEQSRRNFVADVSHELRTPLTTIKSYSETLADMPDCDRELQVRFLNVIAGEADRMARIIRDLLTLSELDAAKNIYRNPEAINVRDMVTSIVERMEITAKKREQTLVYHPINDMPVIYGHPDSLERIIINIISNALKYTPSGGSIEVYTSKVYKDICIKVVDNGIGIPKDKLPNIFDRFYRVDKARSRDTGGTGLGLAIAKQTLESGFNGNIIINSEINKGTEVIITIPAEKGV